MIRSISTVLLAFLISNTGTAQTENEKNIEPTAYCTLEDQKGSAIFYLFDPHTDDAFVKIIRHGQSQKVVPADFRFF